MVDEDREAGFWRRDPVEPRGSDLDRTRAETANATTELGLQGHARTVPESDRRQNDARMHSLFVIDSLTPGGTETPLAAMAPHASPRARPRVLFVLTSTNRRGAEIEGLGVADGLRLRGLDVHAAALALGANKGQLPVRVLGPSARSLRTLRALRREARSVDVVVAYGSSTLPACAIALFGARVPFVYRSIGDPGQWVRGRLHRARTALLMRRAVHVAALWPGAADSIRRLYRLPDKRVSVVTNARDSRELRPATTHERTAARTQFGIDPDAPCVAVIGALSEEKQLDVALHAIARVPVLQVLIAGEGPRRHTLESLAEAILAGRYRFLGAVDDIGAVLHAVDAIVLTSRTEGLPGALIEGGLCGIAAVSTDVGGVCEIVEDGVTGRLVPIGDIAATAEALAAVLERSVEMGTAARLRCAQRFDTERALDQWEALLRGLAAPR